MTRARERTRSTWSCTTRLSCILEHGRGQDTRSRARDRWSPLLLAPISLLAEQLVVRLSCFACEGRLAFEGRVDGVARPKHQLAISRYRQRLVIQGVTGSVSLDSATQYGFRSAVARAPSMLIPLPDLLTTSPRTLTMLAGLAKKLLTRDIIVRYSLPVRDVADLEPSSPSPRAPLLFTVNSRTRSAETTSPSFQPELARVPGLPALLDPGPLLLRRTRQSN